MSRRQRVNHPLCDYGNLVWPYQFCPHDPCCRPEVNLTNKDGSTALHTAAYFCRKDIVALLSDNGADKKVVNNSGATARQMVEAPFEAVKSIYQHFENTLGPEYTSPAGIIPGLRTD